MSDVQVWFRAPSGNGKTWLAVNVKAFFEQMGFEVSSITEGKSCDVFTVREPVPVINSVARGRSLVAALSPLGALPHGIERITRLPQVHNAVEVMGGVHCTGHVDYDKTTPPIQANHISHNSNTGEWELGLTQKSMSNKEFQHEYLLDPTPCCVPTPEEIEALNRGDCTPEEMYGVGGKPSCPKCFKKDK